MSVQRWLLTTEYSHSAVPSHMYQSGVRCGPSWPAVATRHVRCFVRKASSSILLMAILRARRCSLGNAVGDRAAAVPAGKARRLAGALPDPVPVILASTFCWSVPMTPPSPVRDTSER